LKYTPFLEISEGNISGRSPRQRALRPPPTNPREGQLSVIEDYQ